MRGCCLLWLSSTGRFLHEVVSSGGGVNPGSSRGVWSGTVSFLNVFRKLFCSFLFMNCGTTVKNCPELCLIKRPILPPISLSHSLPQITRRTPHPHWLVSGLSVYWQRISSAHQTQAFTPCTMPRENDEIPNRSCVIPEELVKYIYSKTSSNYHTIKPRRAPATNMLKPTHDFRIMTE